MKIIRLLVALVFGVFMTVPLTTTIAIASNGTSVASIEAGPSPGNSISMDFQDANLKTVLKIFSQQSGLNFVAGQNVQDRTVTIYFDGVTVEDALNHIMNANNLVYEQEPGSSIFIVKESGAPEVETLTKIYELRYAQLTPPPAEEGATEDDVADILSVMEGVISENGKLVADKRSNSLIITDVPSQFVVIEDVLARLDTRTPQVMIEAEILETTTTVADKFGVNWSGYWGAYSGPSFYTMAPFRGVLTKDSAMGEGISSSGSVSFSGNNAMSFAIRAIKADTDTRILARPKVLTLNNEKAIIELTAETAVATMTSTTSMGATETNKTEGAERIETGITLEVTPQINKDGYITMHIKPEVIVPVLSSFFAGTGTGAKYVDPQTRSTDTTVRVKNGETVVIGGLISRDDTYVAEKVPFLGDLPLLGAAFRYKTKDKQDKELLIFITPRIIDDTAYTLANISEREQEKPKAVREKEIKTVLDLLGHDG